MVRSVIVGCLVALLAACGGGGPAGDAGAADAGLPPLTDAGAGDAGADAGTPDAGTADGGSTDAGGGGDAGRTDAGLDAGRPDAGADAGPVSCALVVCAPWQRCTESSGSARCEDAVSISWVSPVAGASAPSDLLSVPLAIDTTAPEGLDVPWQASGVLASAGLFSGATGVRGDRLLLVEVDAGPVTLTAGWPGGPLATTQLLIGAPIVRLPPVPDAGAATSDFEPGDPAGAAFRRDETLTVEVADALPPLTLVARLDAPGAQPLAVPIVQRCDAGACWQVDLRLAELHFPAFRGRVLVWASGADGGVQTRPRSVPVTRWRWRRQVSGVAAPLSLTRPVAGVPFQILVGSTDTPTAGRLVGLRADGTPFLSSNHAPFVTAAIGGFTSPDLLAVATDAGAFTQPFAIALDGPAHACTTAGTLSACVTASGQMATREAGRHNEFPTCAARPAGVLLARGDSALVTEGGPVCVVRFAWPQIFPFETLQTVGRYRPAFVRDQVFELQMVAAGADGGLWGITRTSAGLVETLLWDGGVVEGVAAIGRRLQPPPALLTYWLYWFTADGRLHAAQYREEGQPLQVLQNEVVSPDPAPEPPAGMVVAQPTSGAGGSTGAVVAVGRSGSVTAWELASLRRSWHLAPGDAGVRGGRAAAGPIGHAICGRGGALLVPSLGDGSLYSFVLDGAEFTWFADPWAMQGRSPQNDQEGPAQQCLP
jgi:hypothetical protein